MLIVFETNGKGFLGWIVELSGAYTRGKTIDEAREKVDIEIIEYKKWLNMPLEKEIITNEKIVETKAAVDDADSEIILEYDIIDYTNIEQLDDDCNKILISANKLQEIYDKCNYKDIVDRTKERRTFYGDVNSTIKKQYEHIVQCEYGYYLHNIGLEIKMKENLVENRFETVKLLKNKYISERNKYYKYSEEDWTLKKVIRRIIWHDRIHGKAIERMENRIKMEIEKMKQ